METYKGVPGMSSKVILHMDMNAFFASVEQQSNPALRGKPVIVCGRGRTVVTTASYEARRYGVKTGMSLYEAKKCCPRIIPVEGNHVKYADTAKKIHEICLEYTCFVEVFSIDEVFMDISQVCESFDCGRIIAKRIQKRVKKEIGISSSVGVAPGKLLAKLASGRDKPSGLVVFNPHDIEEILSQTPVEDICGIGERTRAKLNNMGIETLKELGSADTQLLIKSFGFMGNILKKMGKGEEPGDVSPYCWKEPLKSIGHSNTFPRDTFNIDVVKSFLSLLSEKVAGRLRSCGRLAGKLSLYIRFSDFSGRSRQKTLSPAVKTGRDIFMHACRILKSFMPFKKAVRHIGVCVSSLIPDRAQGFLFEKEKRKEKLAEAMDKINKRYGDFMIRPLAVDIARDFTGPDIEIPAKVHGFPAGFRNAGK